MLHATESLYKPCLNRITKLIKLRGNIYNFHQILMNESEKYGKIVAKWNSSCYNLNFENKNLWHWSPENQVSSSLKYPIKNWPFYWNSLDYQSLLKENNNNMRAMCLLLLQICRLRIGVSPIHSNCISIAGVEVHRTGFALRKGMPYCP